MYYSSMKSNTSVGHYHTTDYVPLSVKMRNEKHFIEINQSHLDQLRHLGVGGMNLSKEKKSDK